MQIPMFSPNLPRDEVNANYGIDISETIADEQWDVYVEQSGGSLLQTSLWGQVKAAQGWRPLRLIVKSHHHIVGGAQILIRPVPAIGAIGYVLRGPQIAGTDTHAIALIVESLQQIARRYRIQYLLIQPPHGNDQLVEVLAQHGFAKSSLGASYGTALRIALTSNLDMLLAQMRTTTRRHINGAQRAGVICREGTEHDLATFYHLHAATAHRRGFLPLPEQYYTQIWRILRPYGYVRLFLAEYAGRATSAYLINPFGDTVDCGTFGWSGEHARCWPNEALHWHIMRWAKEQGYRYCDLGAIDPCAVEAIHKGGNIPEQFKNSPTFFKLGFGGEIVQFPPNYDYVYNPLLRKPCRAIIPFLANSSSVRNLLNSLRMRRKPTV